MRITPKLGEREVKAPQQIEDCISKSGTLEIQMLAPNLQYSWENCKEVINARESLRRVMLHLPFKKHNINSYVHNMEWQQELVTLLIDASKYAKNNLTALGIVCHVEGDTDSMYGAGLLRFLKYILHLLDKTNVYIVLENSICDLSSDTPEQSAAERVILQVEDEHLKGCLDLCHHVASCNVLKEDRGLPPEYAKRIVEVHFSDTLDNDGYKDKWHTHGKVHSDIDKVERDLLYLESIGINLTNTLVTVEVSEDVYEDRFNEIKELGMLYSSTKNI